MTKRSRTALSFPSVKRRKVEADFCGGDITSHGGIPLLSPVDQQLGLSRAAAGALTDPRRQASCDHSTLTLLRQRLYALALGYEDLNDHQELRYIVGIAKNARLMSQAADWLAEAKARYETRGRKQRPFASIQYGARSWDRTRRGSSRRSTAPTGPILGLW